MLSIHTSPYFCFYTTWGNVIRISRHSTTRFVNRTSSNTFSLLKMRFLKIFLNHFLQFYSKCLLCCRLPMCTISSQSLPPLAVSCVNKVFFAVVQSRLFNQSLFEFVQIIDTNLVYTLLHDAPNLVVFGSVGAVWRPQISIAMKSEVSRCSSWVVSRARRANVLSASAIIVL